MDHFNYRGDELFAEDCNLHDIAAEVGTPFYCYSTATLKRHYSAMQDAVKNIDCDIFYAIKANSNIAVIATLASFGAGADVVSGGEFKRALKAGVKPSRMVFSGVGKTADEMKLVLGAGIYQINVESLPELELLSSVANELGVVADISLRVNPDVDAKTHEKITTGKAENKFGIDLDLARDIYGKASKMNGISIKGVALHIGSQLLELEPYREAYLRIADFIKQLRGDGHTVERLDLGGGLGIPYSVEKAPSPQEFGAVIEQTVGGLGCHLAIEPGRVMVGNAGVMVTQVIYMKQGTKRRFAIVDGAMNDLIRPTLYNAYHDIVPLKKPNSDNAGEAVDVVGPICESGDYLGKARKLGDLTAGDFLAVRTAGAYGAVMVSGYNSRPLAPEVLVDGHKFQVVRKRVEIADMLDLETIPDWID